MRFLRLGLGSAVGLALVAGSIAPAEARDRWHGGHHHHRDRGDGFGFGDAVGVAALIGAVAIVATSMKKDRDAQDMRSENNNPPVDDGYSASSSASGDHGDLTSESAAVDACAVAARDEASSNGGYAEVRDIGAPQSIERGWNIDGQVERRAAYRDGGGETRRFTCTVRDGRVADVILSRDLVMQ